jgi:phospholipid/cholesterol/gamma-HCH transport system permease protein
MLTALEGVGRFTLFALRALTALPAAATRPREAGRQLHAVLMGALPLAAVAGLALGVVIWMHLRGVLARFGGAEAVRYLPTALALAVTLEFAPIGAGLIVAGRSGASLGAELGSMKLTEQLDALEMLGVSAVRRIVGPRVLACVVALPLLTVFIDFLAFAGSYAAERLASGAGWVQYEQALLAGLRFRDVLLATLKTLMFGFLIGVSGSYFGVHAEGGTEGVGRAATRGVVVATLCVLLSNVLLVRLIQLAG